MKFNFSANSGPDENSVLGKVPHQIRGSLGQFKNTTLTGRAYDKCTACSANVRAAFEIEGNAFLLKVLADPKHLEEITGLQKLHQETDDVVFEWDED